MLRNSLLIFSAMVRAPISCSAPVERVVLLDEPKDLRLPLLQGGQEFPAQRLGIAQPFQEATLFIDLSQEHGLRAGHGGVHDGGGLLVHTVTVCRGSPKPTTVDIASRASG